MKYIYIYIYIYLYINILLGFHIGDFGNIEANENGTATVDIILDKGTRPTLDMGNTSILGRSLVIHRGK